MGRPKGSRNKPKLDTEAPRRGRDLRKVAAPAAETQRFYLFDTAPIAVFATKEEALLKAAELSDVHAELAIAIGDVKMGRTRTMFVFDQAPEHLPPPRVERETSGAVAHA